MKNITVGRIGPDWKMAASVRYYAERDGGEYAFGTTPTEAVAQLERRETAVGSTLTDDIADEIAFLALGAAAALRDHGGANLDAYGGYMGFIAEVTRHAHMLANRWDQFAEGEFEGVWLYDVTERFGREWAETLLDGTDEDPAERLEYIVQDEMEKWQ